MYFSHNKNYYLNSIRPNLISKYNILNIFEIKPFYILNLIFILKKNKKTVNLFLFWLIFILLGKKPLLLKTHSDFKKKKFKFIASLNIASVIDLLQAFSIHILSNAEKGKKLIMKTDNISCFFIYKDTYLDFLDTYKIFNFITNSDLNFLIENLFFIFKFKTTFLKKLCFFLNSFQIPV